MSWTRKSQSVALALAAIAGVAGCQSAPTPAAEEASTAPLVVDEAIQARDWPQTTAEFQATHVEAGSTRYTYTPQTKGEGTDRAILGPERSNAVLDTAYFVGESLVLPFTYFWDKPFVKKTYSGVVYNPTHFAMPLLPPDESPWDHPKEKTVEPVITDETAIPDEGGPLDRETTPPPDVNAPVTDEVPPEPAAAEPMPAATEPEPAATEPEPAATEPEPAAAEPEPVPADTEAEPTTVSPETSIPEDTAAPAEDSAAPAEGTATPAEESAAPAEDSAAPAEGTATPAEGTATPAEESAAPAEDSATPAEDTATPAEDSATPAEDSATPADGAESDVDANK